MTIESRLDGETTLAELVETAQNEDLGVAFDSKGSRGRSYTSVRGETKPDETGYNPEEEPVIKDGYHPVDGALERSDIDKVD